jgi:hypothetical protein
MMATLMGALVSDGLEDGRVVSGVGGQFNFVSQAFALDDARSIITLKAVRRSKGKESSNVLWSYGHETVPRHYRDIVVSEYGVADLRGRTDAEVIAAMLSIADSRYQPELLARAKEARKIPAHYEISAAHRENTPERIFRALQPLRDQGHLPEYPFGTDFTETEQRLVPALEILQDASVSFARLASLGIAGLSSRTDAKTNAATQECLARLGLAEPKSLQDRIYQTLLRGALRSG